MNALEAVRMDSEIPVSDSAVTPGEATAPDTVTRVSRASRAFLQMSLDNCAQEHSIFMTRFNGLRDMLIAEGVTDEQIRQAHAKLKRSMTDFRSSLKSIPGKL